MDLSYQKLQSLTPLYLVETYTMLMNEILFLKNLDECLLQV